jgi:hypothetical protein
MKKHTGADDPSVVQNSVDSTRRRFLRAPVLPPRSLPWPHPVCCSVSPRSLPDGPSASAS